MHEKACSEENTTKDVAKRPFDQEIGMGVNHGLHQPQQQENSLFELKGKRQEGMKEVDFLDLTGWDHRAIQLLILSILQDKGRGFQRQFRGHQGCLLSFKRGPFPGFNRPYDPHKAVGSQPLSSRDMEARALWK